jgi:hypothetical protein
MAHLSLDLFHADGLRSEVIKRMIFMVEGLDPRVDKNSPRTWANKAPARLHQSHWFLNTAQLAVKLTSKRCTQKLNR